MRKASAAEQELIKKARDEARKKVLRKMYARTNKDNVLVREMIVNAAHGIPLESGRKIVIGDDENDDKDKFGLL